MPANDLSTPGHCSVVSCCSRPLGWSVSPAARETFVAGADFAAPGTKDQTIMFAFVSEKDFTLMLEVDMAYIDWLKRRNLL